MAKRRSSKSPSTKGSEDFHRKKLKVEEDEFSDDDSIDKTEEFVDGEEEAPPVKEETEEEAPPAEKATKEELDSDKSGEESDEVEVMNFSSPLKGKKSSNPYYIHFMLVKKKLVAFYFSRALYGTDRTYANHLMKTLAGKTTPPAWVTDLNVSSDEFNLHVNGVIQPHYSGCKYYKRLFMLDGTYKFKSRKHFVKFARKKAIKIEENLNKTLGTDSKVSVPVKDEDLIEIKDDSVFADVAGASAAGGKLVSILGEDYDPNDFEEYKDLCYAFFKPGGFPSHIGRIVGCSDADIEEPAIYN